MSLASVNYWNGLNRPTAGQIVKNFANGFDYEYKVFDGNEWHDIPGEAIEDLTLSDIQRLVSDRKSISDTYLESQYVDLKALREDFEQEYENLRNKYKTFEILRLTGENNA
jgi:hypothetical protein